MANDEKTTLAYEKNAAIYSQDWLGQPEPTDIYNLIKKYFIAEGRVADIGCGNGRDASWMAQNGFQVVGFDSSFELLQIARNHFPKIDFSQAFLPSLNEITNQYENVFCETVIMHLPLKEIPQALKSLKRILKDNGVLYLSWRVTEKEDARHQDGRLYSAFAPEFFTSHFGDNGRLFFEDKISVSSNKRVCRLIWRKHETSSTYSYRQNR